MCKEKLVFIKVEERERNSGWLSDMAIISSPSSKNKQLKALVPLTDSVIMVISGNIYHGGFSITVRKDNKISWFFAEAGKFVVN